MSKKARGFLILLAAILAFAVFVGYQFYREFQQLQAVNLEKAQVLEQQDAIDKQTKEMQQELGDSKSDSFIERKAREFGWVKPGEIKIVEKDK